MLISETRDARIAERALEQAKTSRDLSFVVASSAPIGVEGRGDLGVEPRICVPATRAPVVAR
jgi:hypothetical protein